MPPEMMVTPRLAPLAVLGGPPVAGSTAYDGRLFPVEPIKTPPLAASPPLTGKGDPEIRVSVPSAFKRYPSVGSPLEKSPFTKMNVPWAAAGVGVGVAPGGMGVGVGAGAELERTPPQPMSERINNKARANILPADTKVFIRLSTRGSSSAG